MPSSRAAVIPIVLLAVVSGPAVGAVRTQDAGSTTGAEWRYHHGDAGGTRYSPLDRIHAGNVDQLRVAWSWDSDGAVEPTELRNQSTPLMIGGVLYFTSGNQRAVIAADARTGHTLWTWQLDEAERLRIAPRRGSGRGVSYWSEGDDARIFVVTPGFHLAALDARTGVPIISFGVGGVVDLKAQLGVDLDPGTAVIGNSSPPTIFDDVVIVGPALAVGLRPPSKKNVPGRILAIDARTGALRWRFNTIPGPGEAGNETWENGSWEYTGNAGAWAPMSLDTQRGLLYVPVEAATGDYYGGHRPGDNLFSTSLVCLDARTGRRVWHFQLIHHEIWDRDIPTAPILADITVDGRRVEAVAQITKQAWTYVFDRVTGEPVWPIVETPVPQSDVIGERTSATQPVPSRPAPFDRQGFTLDDLIDFSPALRAEAIEAVRGFRLSQPFTPPSLAEAPDSTRGTLHLPGTLGGANWEHGAFDPETATLYVGSTTSPSVLALDPDPDRSDMDYVMVSGALPRVQGLPIVKPPYSRITAIDLNTGEHRWMVPNGRTPERIREHTALAGLDIPPTGSFSRPLLLATKTLLFAGEGVGGEAVFRALDKATGRTVWEIETPAAVITQPMTWLLDGTQYIAFWVAGTGLGEERIPARLMVLTTS
jgi:quinoprotein glucose dehydrogenase